MAHVQTQMLTALDPERRVGQLNSAAERADATVARINELEQQLKAAKAVASDAGGDKLIELITESAEANKPTQSRGGSSWRTLRTCLRVFVSPSRYR